ncbi:ABC-type branched-chain amino acid transport system, permease component [Halovivax ruber XH-70]|uniref:ABC-type branched-chain amino acid transport system, permease component n=1 Tax=Halovivax ruber (strain DSM 18193 / JCM 13892 / XH-70) TaxID=797302 RepID=L0ICI3_HALRX|nr:branched-chain amino acid ABC transporter permease [Halovivax ruber]AGB16464.1 ABC-type branched-chain amino acid transport system, permease component [Halovivax ruber XH-70]
MSTDTVGSDGEDNAPAPMVRPSWFADIGRIAAVVAVTYAFFIILGLLAGLNVNYMMSFLERITFYGAVFAMGALALNLHWGYTGMFNIGVIGFMGVGVYAMSFVTASPDASPAGLGLPIPVGILVGFLAACLAGLVIALPALRVRADYFAIITLGFSEIVRLLVLSGSLRTLPGGYGTGGGSGISAPRTDSVVPWLQSKPVTGEIVDSIIWAGINLGGVPDSVMENYIYTGILIGVVILIFLLLTRIAYSPFGRVLKAIREDELAARSLGKRTDRAKVVVFVLGCGLMGLAGMLWLGRRTLVNPNNVRPIWTFYIFVALIVGGAGSNTGSVIGGFVFAAFVYDGPRYLQRVIESFYEVQAPPTIADAFVSSNPMAVIDYLVNSMDEIRYIILGVVLIVLMIKRPQGLLGHRKEIAAAVDLSRHDTSRGGANTTDESGTTGSSGGESDE